MEDDQENPEEICGLINSEEEEVKWNAKDNCNQGSDTAVSLQCGKCPISSVSQPEAQRNSSYPRFIMEIVNMEAGKQEQEEKPVTIANESTLQSENRPRRRKNVPVKFRDSFDTEKDGSANVGGLQSYSEATEKSKWTISQTVRVSRDGFEESGAKKTPKREKKTNSSANEENNISSAGKKQHGRKTAHVPLEIPPELLKAPKEKKEYRCTVCEKIFSNAYKLERHELIHSGEKPYCCSICGRGFNQMGNLKTHYKVHLGQEGAVDSTEDRNPSPTELTEFLKSPPGESKIRSVLCCLECGKDCENTSALEIHNRTAHSGAMTGNTSQLFFCHHCGVKFSEKEKLDQHLKTHMKEKPFSCPECGKRFINESYIQIHQLIHTGEKPFLCSHCGKTFHSAFSLKQHEIQHSGERPFLCSICGKTFRINSYLTAHYRTHNKSRPYICSLCGKAYSRSQELQVHCRIHTGERPYQCRECGKGFSYRQGLRQHQRTHAGKLIGPTRRLGRPERRAKLDM